MIFYAEYTLSLLIVALFLVYSICIEPRWFQIRRFQVKLNKKIPRPISILHLSDIHFTKKNKWKEGFFRKLEAMEPDFIFLTGDIIDHDPGIGPCGKILGRLKAKIAKVAVLGNHDYWDYRFLDSFYYVFIKSSKSAAPNQVAELKRTLEQAGFCVLKNNSQAFEINGQRIVVGGTDDPITQKANFETTMNGMSESSLNVVLTHVLDSIVDMPDGTADLVFSGHHHGGQVRIPFVGGFSRDARLPMETIDGYHVVRGAHCFASRGAGANRILFLRFFCRPEAIWVDILP